MVAGAMVVPAKAAVVWASTPGNLFIGGIATGFVFVYNGSVVTAKVAVKFLRRDGINLSGIQVPGASAGVVYPGQTGASTVPVAAGNTLVVHYTQGVPTDFQFSNNVPASIRVVSDQPIVVGFILEFDGGNPGTCALLPS